MFDHKNTTELNIMGDEVVAAEPVGQIYEDQDVSQFTLTAYSLAEIFGEKLRTVYQRTRGRDYYDLYQIIVGDETPSDETVASIFRDKRAHAPDESYHTSPEPGQGLPAAARDTIADDWTNTLPELVADVPSLDEVEQRLNRYLIETMAPLVDE